jgi:ribonuclease BN (tRNA processing enzyme)
VTFTQGTDLLIHEAYFTSEDFVPDWGRCRCEGAVGLAEMAQVKCLMLFRHSPDRSDSQIDERVAGQRDALCKRGSVLRIDAACVRMTIQLC